MVSRTIGRPIIYKPRPKMVQISPKLIGDFETGSFAGPVPQTFPEAPRDGVAYAREDATWTPLTDQGIQGPAGPPGPIGPPGPPGPSMVSSVSNNMAVIAADSYIYVPDAPIDIFGYGRNSNSWTQVLMKNNDILDGGNF